MRASFLPMAQRCRAAWKMSQAAPRVSGDAALRGRMVHEIAALLLRRGTEIELQELREIAMRHGTTWEQADESATKLNWLLRRHAWGESFCEVEIDDPCSGHMDVALASPDGTEAEVWDFKSGREEVDPAIRNLQLIAYAVGTLSLFPNVQRVKVCIVYTTLGQTDEATFDWGELQRMRETIKTIIAECEAQNPEFTPGVHCARCAGREACPAINKAVATCLNGEAGLSFAAHPNKGLILAQVKTLAAFIKDVQEQAKRWVDDHGPIPCGEFDEFAKEDGKQREIDPAKGWDVLTERCGAHLADAISVGIGAAENAAVDEAEAQAGGAKIVKAKIKREFMKALDEAGAVKMNPTTKYVFRKKKENGNGEANGNAERAIDATADAGAEV